MLQEEEGLRNGCSPPSPEPSAGLFPVISLPEPKPLAHQVGPVGFSWGASVPQSLRLEEKECGLAGWLGSRRSFRAGRGRGRLKRGLLLALRSLLLHSKALPPTFRPCSHVLGALTPRKPMGSPGLAALLLPLLLLLTGLSARPGIACPSLPHWSTRCLLASHMVRPRRRVGTPSWHWLVKLPTLLPVLPYLSSPCALGAASVCPLHGLKGVAKVLVH